MGIPSDYKKYMSNYVPPSPPKKKAGRKKKKQEKRRESTARQPRMKDKGVIPDDLPEIRVACAEHKQERENKKKRPPSRKLRAGERPQTIPDKKPEGTPGRELKEKSKRVSEKKLGKQSERKPEEKREEKGNSIPEKPSFLDFLLSLCDILGAVCLILCILSGVYHDISEVPEASCQMQTAVQLVDVTRTGTKCIDGYMYDAFTMDVAGDKTFYAPENSIKWNKDGTGKKRCTINTLTVSDSFSFTESPFFFTKTRESIGGTENFGDQLKTGDTISVSVGERKNWLLLSRYQVDVQIVRQQYSFEGDNSFTEKEIHKSKMMAEKLCKKKRENAISSFDEIFSVAY